MMCRTSIRDSWYFTVLQHPVCRFSSFFCMQFDFSEEVSILLLTVKYGGNVTYQPSLLLKYNVIIAAVRHDG